MISERQIAKGFQSLWSEVLPLLTPHFVRLFNEAYCEVLTDADGVRASEVPSRDDTDPALVSEFAFHLVRLAHQRHVRIADIAHDEQLRSDAESESLELVSSYERTKEKLPSSLNDSERSEALLLVNNYEHFLSNWKSDEIEFSPLVPGAGFVDACCGDVTVGSALFEVKTVTRNIAGKDMRQLLVYLALQAQTGGKRWPNAGFFNPRRARVYEFSVDKLIPLMSGGRLATEAFSEMVEYFCTRDIELDSAF